MFTLTEEQLWKLWEQNQFPVPKDECVFFGLRGCLPVTDGIPVFAREHMVETAEVNYLNPRCTLGQWLPDKGFALFPGSTVPHQTNVARAKTRGGEGTNQLITGFYKDYRKGVHKAGTPTGHHAFRQERFLPVQRTSDDLDYDPEDRVDWSQAGDNLHAAWSMSVQKGYSSAGCQVVIGYPATPWGDAHRVECGPWKVFRENAYALSQQSFSYVLLNGWDALKAAQPGISLTPRLRYGSVGALVELVQKHLKEGNFYEGKIDGDFGWRTLGAVFKFQKARFGPNDADGVVGPVTAEALRIQWPGAVPTPALSMPQVVAAETRPAEDFHYEGNDAVAPGGIHFAKKFRKGVYNYGKTTIGAFVRLNRDKFANLSPSLLKVMEAVSENEGKLEAINTWDDAFLTFGIFQWTAGTGNAAGELPALLGRLKNDYSALFGELFGQYGLDVLTPRGGFLCQPGVLPSSYFSLDGETLKTEQQKEKLRSLEWAYRFWYAGQHDLMRTVQIKQAMDRITVFYRSPRHQIDGRPIADYVTSELGVALLLDQHVNRPGHVPRTLQTAVTQMANAGDPQGWSDGEEKRLLDIYLDLRAKTSMTDSDKRAHTAFNAVASRIISDRRGSFKLTDSA